MISLPLILLIITILYALLTLMLIVGWNVSTCSGSQPTKNTRLSIIIPARNEAKNIVRCLTSIENQSLNKNQFEVIVVDDNSEDGTYDLVQEYDYHSKLTIQSIKLDHRIADNYGKKKAIKAGIKASSGNLIITTDADCWSGPNWLSSIVTFYRESNYKLIIGPVSFHAGANYFHKLQEVEFMSLIGATCATANLGFPIMCNGANLVVEKEALNGIDGLLGAEWYSGDDVFLLHQIKQTYGAQAIGFLKDKDAIIYTTPSDKILDFWDQRKRWVSKSVGYKDVMSIVVSVIVLLGNLSFIAALVLLLFSIKFVGILTLVLVIKSLIDFTFLYAISRFFNKRKLAWLFIPEQLIYALYVVCIFVVSFNVQYVWKGRRLK